VKYSGNKVYLKQHLWLARQCHHNYLLTDKNTLLKDKTENISRQNLWRPIIFK